MQARTRASYCLLMHGSIFCSIGRPVRLVSNCFDVKLTEQRLKWYKYEVRCQRLPRSLIGISLTFIQRC